MTKTLKTEVCIIGAGAGGIGCAYRLIKNGVNTVVVDKNPDFGGTMVFGGVDGWEPGVSLDGLHQLLYAEMSAMDGGCHVVEVVPNGNFVDPTVGRDWTAHSFKERPFGYSMAMGGTYEDTLKRCTSLRGEKGPYVRLQFEPEAMIKAVHNIFAPFSERLKTLFETSFKSCRTENGKIVSVTVSGADGDTEIFADTFVDSSGDIILARSAGCETAFGTEGREVYDEPCADESSRDVNGTTYVFRIAKHEDDDHIDSISEEYLNVDLEAWKASYLPSSIVCFVKYPNGDINVNMLPTMQGREYFDFGEDADKIGRARVYAYFEYMQKERGLKGYTLKHIYSAGIREGYRLVGKYVLREQDVRAGINRQPKLGRTVAIADHALDIHGKKGMCRELTVPYEIPLECTMAKEFDNLFVACRGASFSHIASSSVRLSRTMLSLGEGVGEYISEKIKEKL